MTLHLNQYSQTGCIGCKPCEGGAANIGRSQTLLWGGIFTMGLLNLVTLFTKKCVYCGHRTWWNSHTTPAQQAASTVR